MSLGGASYVGPYRLLHLIRSGRCTQVWAAIDDARHRRYALKILLPEYQNDSEQRRLMEHELAIGSKLDHPRLLGPHTLLDAKQGRCLLMEFVAGRNLRELMTGCRGELAVCMPAIIRQSAEALAELHSLGLIHLDVKPDNFLLDEQMNVRLIDFGLARRPPATWERWFWKRRRKVIQGTRSYLAPEQIRREPPDYRTDVYGLGCTFYHLATNTPPFVGATSNELLQKHLHEPPPNPIKINPDVTREFARLVRSMMAKGADSRPTAISAVLAELKAIKIFHSQIDDPEAESAAPSRAKPSIPAARSSPRSPEAAVARNRDVQQRA